MFDLTNTFLKIWALDILNNSTVLFSVVGGISAVAFIVVLAISIDAKAEDGREAELPMKALLILISLAFLFFSLTTLIPSNGTIKYAKIAIIANDCSKQFAETELGQEAKKGILKILKDLYAEEKCEAAQ